MRYALLGLVARSHGARSSCMQVFPLLASCLASPTGHVSVKAERSAFCAFMMPARNVHGTSTVSRAVTVDVSSPCVKTEMRTW